MNPFPNWICTHVLLDMADRRRQEKMDWGWEGCSKLSVTLNLIIFALMTPLVQESIQFDWLQGHAGPTTGSGYLQTIHYG